MNFAITGKKILSSPQPEKKGSQLPVKPKVESKLKQEINPASKKPSVPIVNKRQSIKVPAKKEQLKAGVPKIEEVKPEVKPQEKPVKIEQPPLLQIDQMPAKWPPKISEILVRYNHYKDKFPTENNILKYGFIEDKYSFASVFKGNYIPKLQIYRNYGKYIEPLTSGKALDFTWEVDEGKEYEITIAEDQEEESKYERKAYIAPKEENKCPLKKNPKVAELTQEMRNMAVQELGSEKHKELLEQRALQQVLYS